MLVLREENWDWVSDFFFLVQFSFFVQSDLNTPSHQSVALKPESHCQTGNETLAMMSENTRGDTSQQGFPAQQLQSRAAEMKHQKHVVDENSQKYINSNLLFQASFTRFLSSLCSLIYVRESLHLSVCGSHFHFPASSPPSLIISLSPSLSLCLNWSSSSGASEWSDTWLGG